MREGDPPTGNGHNVYITLVHGTWPRGIITHLMPKTIRAIMALLFSREPYWFEKDSAFCKTLHHYLLQNNVTPQLDSYQWSGDNSIYERSVAAWKLAQCIDTRCTDLVNVIIAHSHGGSVAMLALKHLNNYRNVLLITMSTPFLEVIEERFSENHTKALNAMFLTFGLGLSIFVFLPLCARLAEFFGHSAPNPLPEFLSLLAFMSGWLFSIAVLIQIFFGLRNSFGRRSHAMTLAKHTENGLSLHKPIPMLVIRGTDDEASLFLTAGAIGNRLATFGFHIIIFVLTLVSFLFVPLGVLNVWDRLRDVLPNINWYAVCWVGIPGSSLFLLLLSQLFKSGYGRELMLKSQLCQVKSHSAPDHSGNVTVITLAPSRYEGMGLRHSIYEHEDMAKTISEWIVRTNGWAINTPINTNG